MGYEKRWKKESWRDEGGKALARVAHDSQTTTTTILSHNHNQVLLRGTLLSSYSSSPGIPIKPFDYRQVKKYETVHSMISLPHRSFIKVSAHEINCLCCYNSILSLYDGMIGNRIIARRESLGEVGFIVGVISWKAIKDSSW